MAKLVLTRLIFWLWNLTEYIKKINLQSSLLPEHHAQPETVLPKELKVFCNNATNHSIQQTQTHSVAVSPQSSIYRGKKNLDLLYSIWTVANENLPKIRIINSFTQAVFYAWKKHRMGVSKINKNSALLTNRTFCVIQKYLQTSRTFYHQKHALAFKITTFSSLIVVYWWPLNWWISLTCGISSCRVKCRNF